jgi:sortase (surface protein transpeptidase)
MFLALWDVRPGDEVFVSAPDGRVLLYVVRDVLPRVAPADVSSTRPTTTERLTLQTSTGPHPADPRFVVFAFLRGG